MNPLVDKEWIWKIISCCKEYISSFTDLCVAPVLGDVLMSNEQDFNLVWFFYRCVLQPVLHSSTKD